MNRQSLGCKWAINDRSFHIRALVSVMKCIVKNIVGETARPFAGIVQIRQWPWPTRLGAKRLIVLAPRSDRLQNGFPQRRDNALDARTTFCAKCFRLSHFRHSFLVTWLFSFLMQSLVTGRWFRCLQNDPGAFCGPSQSVKGFCS